VLYRLRVRVKRKEKDDMIVRGIGGMYLYKVYMAMAVTGSDRQKTRDTSSPMVCNPSRHRRLPEAGVLVFGSLDLWV
jgi:hypothetical protein